MQYQGRVKSIYLLEGRIVSATSNQKDDRLGDVLVRAGKLSTTLYENAGEEMRRAGKRLGAVLVQSGALTPHQLFEGLNLQVQEIIYSLFLWEEGQYEFAPGHLPQQVIPLKLDLATLISSIIVRMRPG